MEIKAISTGENLPHTQTSSQDDKNADEQFQQIDKMIVKTQKLLNGELKPK